MSHNSRFQKFKYSFSFILSDFYANDMTSPAIADFFLSIFSVVAILNVHTNILRFINLPIETHRYLHVSKLLNLISSK